MTDLSHAIGAIERELSANEYMRHEGPENNSLRAALAILRRHDAVVKELERLRDHMREEVPKHHINSHMRGRYGLMVDCYERALRLIRGEEGGR